MNTTDHIFELFEGVILSLEDSEWVRPRTADDLLDDEGHQCRVGIWNNEIVEVFAPINILDTVPVKVRLCDGSPGMGEVSNWDQVVEVSIRCDSGVLQVNKNMFQSAHSIQLPSPGNYRLRVSMGDLDSMDDDEPTFHYLFEFWPQGALENRKILKWWDPWKPLPAPTIPGRRTIHGVEAFRKALRELSMQIVGNREYEPTEEIKAILPEHKETALLYKDVNGQLWEYTVEPPQRLPFLKEITLEEAKKDFGYEE